MLSRLISTPSRTTGELLTDKDVRDEIVTLMLAGQDTTANMLGWVLCFVASVPKLQDLVQDEVDKVLQGRTPFPDDLKDLRVLRKVVLETLRLIPTVWIMSAQTERDVNIGGHEIPANATVLLSPYVTHRLPGIWPDPDEFDAERFEQDYRLTRPRYSYFPFGGGRHRCLGEWFAMMEIMTVITAILQNFVLRFESEPRLKPFVATTLQLDPTDTLVLEERTG